MATSLTRYGRPMTEWAALCRGAAGAVGATAGHIVALSVRQAGAEVERCTAFVEGRLREVAAS
jgi:hypothetical protein